MPEDVKIKDLGFQRSVDRLAALKYAGARIGIFNRRMAKIGSILEHKYGWKAAGDRRIERMLSRMLEEVQRGVIVGKEPFSVILDRFAERAADQLRAEIEGKGGIIGDPETGPGLVDTGALLASIDVRVRAPR